MLPPKRNNKCLLVCLDGPEIQTSDEINTTSLFVQVRLPQGKNPVDSLRQGMLMHRKLIHLERKKN